MLRATSSCLSALVSPPHAHHGRCTAHGRCSCSAAAEFASHLRCACANRSPHPTAFIWSAPKAPGLDRRAQPHSSRPRPTEQRHAHAHAHGHSGCGVGRPVVRRKRPSRAASEKRRVWGHRRVSRARIAAGGGLRATSSCLSAVVSQPHAHHDRCTAHGRCRCSAAAEFASHQRGACESLGPIPQHPFGVHRRQQGLIGGHSRIAAAPSPRSNAMHTPTPTGIAAAALVGLACAGSGPREPHQKSACLGAQASHLSPHSGWWRPESDQQLLKCSGTPGQAYVSTSREESSRKSPLAAEQGACARQDRWESIRNLISKSWLLEGQPTAGPTFGSARGL